MAPDSSPWSDDALARWIPALAAAVALVLAGGAASAALVDADASISAADARRCAIDATAGLGFEVFSVGVEEESGGPGSGRGYAVTMATSEGVIDVVFEAADGSIRSVDLALLGDRARSDDAERALRRDGCG